MNCIKFIPLSIWFALQVPNVAMSEGYPLPDCMKLLAEKGAEHDRPHWKVLQGAWSDLSEGVEPLDEVTSQSLCHLLTLSPADYPRIEMIKVLAKGEIIPHPDLLPSHWNTLDSLIYRLVFLRASPSSKEDDVLNAANQIGLLLERGHLPGIQRIPLKEAMREVLPLLLEKPMKSVHSAYLGLLSNPLYEMSQVQPPDEELFSANLVLQISETYGVEAIPLFEEYLQGFVPKYLENAVASQTWDLALDGEFAARNRAIFQALRKTDNLDRIAKDLLPSWEEKMNSLPKDNPASFDLEYNLGQEAMVAATKSRPPTPEESKIISSLDEKKRLLWARGELEKTIRALDEVRQE